MHQRRTIIVITMLLLLFILIRSNQQLLLSLMSAIVEEEPSYSSGLGDNSKKMEPKMSLAVVVCGDRSQEALVMIKSVLFFTKSPVKFYVLTEDHHNETFQEKLSDWQKTSGRDFYFEVLPVTFPPGELQHEWRKLFKPCAAQRLFFPSVLENVESLIYVDTDTLFLGPLDQVWEHFDKMNSSQFVALAPEHEDPNVAWYNRFARHPFYKPLGVNTGVMLMNLTRMRKFGWEQYLVPIYKLYKLKIPWGDQDIINIIFHYHPEGLYIYSCKYNYRADHCMYTSVCKVAEKEGIVVLHGSRGVFHSDKHPPFRDVYRAMEEYQWGTDQYSEFYMTLRLWLDTKSSSMCSNVKDAFTKNIERYIEKTNGDDVYS